MEAVKVLIIDDKQENLDLLERVLNNLCVEFTSLTNAEKAIELSQTIKFDLCIIDIRMPMDGFSVYDQITETQLNSSLPVIYMAEKTDLQNMERAYSRGCLDLISRPFRADELFSKISIHTKILSQQKDLKNLINSKEKILSMVAHELRSPFNALIGFSDLLMSNYKSNEDDTNQFFMEKINSISNQTLTLLNDLLNYSLHQQDKILSSVDELNLKSVLEGVCLQLKPIANLKEIHMNKLVEGDPIIKGDKAMLATLFRNLISNAIKFTPHRGAIKLDVYQEKNEVIIKIEDKGVGMEEEEIKNLFKMDERITKKGTNNEIGSGYGLLLVKEIIEKHQGIINVESKKGEGSIFTVILPLS